MTADAIVFRDVVKRFGDVTALNRTDFAVAKGEVLAMLGPNGAGKSTAVDLLLGLRKPDEGTISVLGTDPAKAVSQGRVSAMLQRGSLPAGARVAEIVDLSRRLYGSVRSLDEVLGLAGLDGIAKRRADALSGGQAQRVRFGMALAGKPELLFLDEPTVALDVEARQHFWRSVQKVAAEGTTVVFATHYLDEADENADRIVVLNSGVVVADGPPSTIKAVATVRVVRCVLDEPDLNDLQGLPGVVSVEVHGQEVALRCDDADSTVAEMYARYGKLRDIQVSGAGLEDALLALTSSGDAR
ncbi:ABC transporter ATP-binding protein [Kutzneria buriramensis]|uniref:ABC-2 type transport system ATP-binding protein n=1 Tax=Kutzneria buriramensis TaxID=1045776 RepID=A0A3E0HF62_9PSEU|nr:ABC transporter ATP-binding protein [Kutzneria buriramensis]REH43840.1 ABC-2 type transport system ATP-binding protein [Kutzneria buriramensis]